MDSHSNNNKLTEHMVLTKTRANSLTNIVQLNMWGYNLVDVSLFEYMENIEVVSLSINNIRSLQPFSKCTKLRQLLLRHNEIDDFDQLNFLINLHNLTNLGLSENPIASQSNYREIVINKLPQLKILDSIEITESERHAKSQYREEPITSSNSNGSYRSNNSQNSNHIISLCSNDLEFNDKHNNETNHRSRKNFNCNFDQQNYYNENQEIIETTKPNDSPRRHRRRRNRENSDRNKIQNSFNEEKMLIHSRSLRYSNDTVNYSRIKSNESNEDAILTAVLALLPELSSESLSIVINTAKRVSIQKD
ncbi:Leucine Rich Repeat family protein [Tritrichomonas foetus]|uniref:Leucine Rich Repeat family protein n=1 Tax=Tritrichomonas foetus TaxID=1144522 RepID=A0A1J4JJ37_9EUKA|nr:Leucine Rich Repeat family protein [Tritrichomonas foetus]|eukprot:OHS99174.1 Leucine Rich Repeat family protein [Tritrichomonas foetus]